MSAKHFLTYAVKVALTMIKPRRLENVGELCYNKIVDLKIEQEKTLSQPRRNYSLLAGVLFKSLDLFYGKDKSISKFKVLEVIARVPYQSWEHVGYIAMTHTYNNPEFSRHIFDFVRESRGQQDNEQWHLFILQEMIHKKNKKESLLLYGIIPQIMAFFYYHVSWLLYVINPKWSYALNVDFEDHAEHEYMEFVREHPEFESEPFKSEFENDYGKFNSLADLFRSIGLDERHHKEESLTRVEHPRY